MNTSADAKQAVPTFDDGQHIKLGGTDTFGAMTTATVCDLTGNKLPNLIVTNNAGAISYATNTGTLGSPQFGPPAPMMGVNTFPKILRPIGWNLFSPLRRSQRVARLHQCHGGTRLYSAAEYDLQKMPFVITSYPITNKYFPDFYYPSSDQLFDDQHRIGSSSEFGVKERYHLPRHFLDSYFGKYHEFDLPPVGMAYRARRKGRRTF